MTTETKTLTTKQVADRLVALCREGSFASAIDELYAPDIVSIEPPGSNAPERLEGLENVKQKTVQFDAMVEAHHGITVSDPVIAEDHFAISMVMDCTFKGMGRTTMSEVCVYRVKDGKVVWEQFCFSPMPSQN